MERKRATITDVAAHAGVSKATVSAVLNSSANVRDSTRQKVLAAVEQLDYRPGARGEGRTGRDGQAQSTGHPAEWLTDRSLAVLVREGDNPYFAEVVTGARAVADARGYTLLVVSSEGNYEAERRAVRLLRVKEVDGLMVYPVLDDHADLSHFFELRRRNYPFVLLEGVLGLPASLVDADNRAAARVAAEHLLALGHTRLVHFAGPNYSLHTRERVDGVRQACSAALVRFADAHVVPAGASVDDGRRAALAYFTACAPEERPTGVTCYNDLVAAGVCGALAELGLRVPHDVSVVGFDDIPLARHLPVPLTTIAAPKQETGRLAAELLIAQIEARAPLVPERHYLDAPLVVRASTAPPPDG
jgi:DNA-binding LacI/PurR family transcriptional regulator